MYLHMYSQTSLIRTHPKLWITLCIHSYVCVIPAVMRRGTYIHICILNICTGPEIAVCHLPLSTYMYNTTKVTFLFDVSMLGT